MRNIDTEKKVLVIEDDMIIFKIISSVLKKYGFSAVNASKRSVGVFKGIKYYCSYTRFKFS